MDFVRGFMVNGGCLSNGQRRNRTQSHQERRETDDGALTPIASGVLRDLPDKRGGSKRHTLG